MHYENGTDASGRVPKRLRADAIANVKDAAEPDGRFLGKKEAYFPANAAAHSCSDPCTTNACADI